MSREVERIFTVELTQILTVPDEEVADYEQLSEAERSQNEKGLKKLLNIDKADITGYKCFIHEPKAEGPANE